VCVYAECRAAAGGLVVPFHLRSSHQIALVFNLAELHLALRNTRFFPFFLIVCGLYLLVRFGTCSGGGPSFACDDYCWATDPHDVFGFMSICFIATSVRRNVISLFSPQTFVPLVVLVFHYCSLKPIAFVVFHYSQQIFAKKREKKPGW